MVWNSSRSFLMELNAAEMSRANRVERGTVIITKRKVFFSACRKYGSCST